MRRYQDPIRIDRHLSLETIKIILSNPDYGFFENDIFSEKYRSKISIGIWKDCIVLYPLEKCSKEFINEVKEQLEAKNRKCGMILCEKCEDFLFPDDEDEDGYIGIGCKEPKVVDVFMNFFRKFQCKYYKQIAYPKMQKEVKNRLRAITRFSFYHRDPHPHKPGRFRKWQLSVLKSDITRYLAYRDYLFTIKEKECEG
ncbi:MAG: hypothetical protein ACFFCI_23830 [Promethearchaeota archaeon]